jgi:hypothetical protein
LTSTLLTAALMQMKKLDIGKLQRVFGGELTDIGHPLGSLARGRSDMDIVGQERLAGVISYRGEILPEGLFRPLLFVHRQHTNDVWVVMGSLSKPNASFGIFWPRWQPNRRWCSETAQN